MSDFDNLMKEKDSFFNFMQVKYPIYFHSNIFLRDIQFAIKYFFKKKGVKLTYSKAEELAKLLTGAMEKSGDLKRLADNTWEFNINLNKSNDIVMEPSDKSSS